MINRNIITLRREMNIWNSIRSYIYLIFPVLLAFPIAYGIGVINKLFPNQQEKAVMLTGVFCVFLIALPAAIYLGIKREKTDPQKLGLILLSAVSIVLVSIYFFWASSIVRFPADILVWAESDFVNDILKFRNGYPIYSDQLNNDSFVYPPGSQLFTYFLAWLFGDATSVGMYRAIQVGYSLLSALAGVFISRRIIELDLSPQWLRENRIWTFIGYPFIFLVATNSLTNRYVHYLHGDALALLVSVIAYYILVKYAIQRDKKIIVWMVIIPTLGFWVKQSLVIWAVLYGIYFLIFDWPRSITRTITYGGITIGSIALSIGIGFLIWKQNFIYWVFNVLGSHGVSPLRSFQHLLDVWPYVGIGIFGGLVLLRGRNTKILIGPWVIWLIFISIEIYTSGIAWMLNHIGPGSLLAGVWFLAALPRLLETNKQTSSEADWKQYWFRTGAGMLIIALLFSGLGLVRIPITRVPDDAYRYIDQIESEFQGFSAQEVLLDAGTWVYLDDNIIMKDRAPSIGERGYSQTGDFSELLQRIEKQEYAKIMVRRLNDEDFWYDHHQFPKSSGIRQALLDNYMEIRLIEAVEGQSWYLFQDLSVLVPK